MESPTSPEGYISTDERIGRGEIDPSFYGVKGPGRRRGSDATTPGSNKEALTPQKVEENVVGAAATHLARLGVEYNDNNIPQ